MNGTRLERELESTLNKRRQGGCVFRGAYPWVFGAAGKGHAAFLTARVRVGAVEVDVQIPVISSKSAATLPLRGQEKHKNTHMAQEPTGTRRRDEPELKITPENVIQ